MHKPYNPHFKDELVTTGLVMAVMITGSFFFASRMAQQKIKSPEISITDESQVLGTTEKLVDEIQKTIEATQASPIPLPTLSPISASPASSSAREIPQYSNTVIEQPYGVGGSYENDSYILTLSNPRLVVSTSRVFKVDVVLANKSIEAGLKNRLSATIIKEGKVIAASVPFSLSESATAYPGEQITFSATISLISGTDISGMKYLPLTDGIVDTVHDL